MATNSKEVLAVQFIDSQFDIEDTELKSPEYELLKSNVLKLFAPSHVMQAMRMFDNDPPRAWVRNEGETVEVYVARMNLSLEKMFPTAKITLKSVDSASASLTTTDDPIYVGLPEILQLVKGSSSSLSSSTQDMSEYAALPIFFGRLDADGNYRASPNDDGVEIVFTNEGDNRKYVDKDQNFYEKQDNGHFKYYQKQGEGHYYSPEVGEEYYYTEGTDEQPSYCDRIGRFDEEKKWVIDGYDATGTYLGTSIQNVDGHWSEYQNVALSETQEAVATQYVPIPSREYYENDGSAPVLPAPITSEIAQQYQPVGEDLSVYQNRVEANMFPNRVPPNKMEKADMRKGMDFALREFTKQIKDLGEEDKAFYNDLLKQITKLKASIDGILPISKGDRKAYLNVSRKLTNIHNFIPAERYKGQLTGYVLVQIAFLEKDRRLNPSKIDKAHYREKIDELNAVLQEVKLVNPYKPEALAALGVVSNRAGVVVSETNAFFAIKCQVLSKARNDRQALNLMLKKAKGVDKKYLKEYLLEVRNIKKYAEASRDVKEINKLQEAGTKLGELEAFYRRKLTAGNAVQIRIEELNKKVKGAKGEDKKYYQEELQFIRGLKNTVDGYKFSEANHNRLGKFKQELEKRALVHESHVIAKEHVKGRVSRSIGEIKQLKKDAGDKSTRKYLEGELKGQEEKFREFKGFHPTSQHFNDLRKKKGEGDSTQFTMVEKVQLKNALIKETKEAIAQFIEKHPSLKAKSFPANLMPSKKPEALELRKMQDLLKEVKAVNPGNSEEIKSLKTKVDSMKPKVSERPKSSRQNPSD